MDKRFPIIHVWCLDKVTFKIIDYFYRGANYTQAHSLQDCRVQNQVYFWGGKIGNDGIYVVYDRKNEETYTHHVDYSFRGTLWNNFVLFYDRHQQNFVMWDKNFTKSTIVFKTRYGSLVPKRKINL